MLLLRRGLVALTCLLSTALFASAALYEDQVGMFDWHREGLGKVSHTVLPSKNNKNHQVSKAIYVATMVNVLAKLDAKTSDIEWRQYLPDSSINQVTFCDTHESLISVSSVRTNASCSPGRGKSRSNRCDGLDVGTRDHFGIASGDVADREGSSLGSRRE